MFLLLTLSTTLSSSACMANSPTCHSGNHPMTGRHSQASWRWSLSQTYWAQFSSIPGTVTPFRHSVSTTGWRSQGSKDNGRFSDPFFLRSYNSNLARSFQTPFLNHSSTWIIRNIQCSHLIVEPLPSKPYPSTKNEEMIIVKNLQAILYWVGYYF